MLCFFKSNRENYDYRPIYHKELLMLNKIGYTSTGSLKRKDIVTNHVLRNLVC